MKRFNFILWTLLTVLLLWGCGKETAQPLPAETTTVPEATTENTTASTEPTPPPEEYVLTKEQDPEKLCLMFRPTGVVTEGEDCRYFTPADQEFWLAEYTAALAKVDPEGHWDPADSSSGIWIRYKYEWWQLMENGDFLGVSSGRIPGEHATILAQMCRDSAQKLGLSQPVRPSQIQNIQSATLEWEGSHTITDPGKLAKLERWLSNSTELYGGAQCWFTATLTLRLENGEALVLSMATDSCRSWLSEGIFYDYGSGDNTEFFELFTENASDAEEAASTLKRDSFVPLVYYLPAHQIQLAYAGEQNFTGQKIYDFAEAYLRRGTAQKLAAAEEELETYGLSLKVWDAYRPLSAQAKLWEACPNPAYVSPPGSGNRTHCRGSAVDVTLIDASGVELEMPSGFDDFTALGDRDYADCSAEAAANATLLQKVMESHGFQGYDGEWWHFTDTDTYPIEEQFQPCYVSILYTDCQEFITLRAEPSTSAEALLWIPAGAQFMELAVCGEFSYVSYDGQLGYVLRSYTQPS